MTTRSCVYSITLSARATNVAGTVTPSAFAVLRLITNSNLVGCWTGMSEGLTPRRSFTSGHRRLNTGLIYAWRGGEGSARRALRT